MKLNIFKIKFLNIQYLRNKFGKLQFEFSISTNISKVFFFPTSLWKNYIVPNINHRYSSCLQISHSISTFKSHTCTIIVPYHLGITCFTIQNTFGHYLCHNSKHKTTTLIPFLIS